MRWVAVVLFVLSIGSLVVVREARACSCIAPPPPKVAAEQASRVFEGEVTGIERGEGGVVATFHVLRGWKGVSEQEVEVRTADSSAACGLGFAEGQRWLLYTYEDGGQTHAGLCSRSTQSANAAADIAALGAPSYQPDGAASPPPGAEPLPAPAAAPDEPGTEPAAPVEVSAPPPEPTRGGCAGCTLGAPDMAGAWMVAAGLALWMMRRTRAR